MANLTIAQYKTELDNALAGYNANNFYNIERGMAWAQIASVYSHMYSHQFLFATEVASQSSLALGYRTKAEAYLVSAKTLANQPGNTPAAVAAVQAASVAAHTWAQIVKIQSTVV